MQLTERDIAIVQSVAVHRLLTSDQIHQLVGGSAQRVRRRLQLLFHHRYLDRPRAQIEHHLAALGSKPMVYALANKGADLIGSLPDGERPAGNWTAKNRTLQPASIDHAVMVASIKVVFEVGARKAGNLRLVQLPDIVQERVPEKSRQRSAKGTWRVKVPGFGIHGVTPDAIFAFEFADLPPGKNQALFFLEADRATMPVYRKKLTASSVYRKLLTYHATLRSGVHTRLFGFKRFRVLTVTKSADGKRTNSLVKAAARLHTLGQHFLFTDFDSLAASDSIQDHPWVNGDSEVVTLAP